MTATKKFTVMFDYEIFGKNAREFNDSITVEAENEEHAKEVARKSHLHSGGNFHAYDVYEAV